MKNVSSAFQALLDGGVTRLAYVIKIKRTDNVILGFTTHDRSILYNSVKYSPVNSMSLSAIVENSDLTAPNLDLTGILERGILSSDSITDDDIQAGRYDNARVDVWMIDWANPTVQGAYLRRGFMGPITQLDGQYKVTVLGLAQAIQQDRGEYFVATCTATFGDARCKSPVAHVYYEGSILVSGAGTAGLDLFTTNLPGADGVFSNANIIWTSGLNNGSSIEVALDNGVNTGRRWLSLFTLTGRPISNGDTFRIAEGCTKIMDRCLVLQNLNNFRGFPAVPGSQVLAAYPDTASGQIGVVG